jgi:prefoldin subunit 5
MASIDEETKNAVRKLNREKDELKKENESLKKKVHELEKFESGEQLSARRSVCFIAIQHRSI